MRRGGDRLRVAANGASIGVPDQKLSRLEAANEQWRIDSESILNRFSVNSVSISACERREEWLSLPFIAIDEWQFRNFAVWSVLDRTLNMMFSGGFVKHWEFKSAYRFSGGFQKTSLAAIVPAVEQTAAKWFSRTCIGGNFLNYHKWMKNRREMMKIL
ncbi:hypothetical protein PIB30_059485 [Stylosanthes scabra]|uniref:Uncharacterized protein n=1 Tax=Stylosanthes scabra TaxID=79078 RepID=A0ABU6SL90_9FABA|nr:hypothetical protein [Stylosanthes scabra]